MVIVLHLVILYFFVTVDVSTLSRAQHKVLIVLILSSIAVDVWAFIYVKNGGDVPYLSTKPMNSNSNILPKYSELPTAPTETVLIMDPVKNTQTKISSIPSAFVRFIGKQRERCGGVIGVSKDTKHDV